MPTDRHRPEHSEERALVAGCLAGDEAAWTRLVETYSGLVWSVARRALRSRGLAGRADLLEDLYGEAFAALCQDDFRHLRRFQWKCSLSRWIGLLAHSSSVNALSRKQVPTLPASDAAEWAARLPAEAPSPLVRLEKAEALQALRSALDDAPPRERLILQLHYLDQLSYAEIARALSVSVNSVGPLIARATSRLRRTLDE